MTAKEKARELVNEFIELVPVEFEGMDRELAKQCALICVDEILKTNPNNLVEVTKNNRSVMSEFNWNVDYWEKVKQEIKKL